MVFSSSAATYGMPDVSRLLEDIDCKPIDPYGQTKLIGEWTIDNAMVATGRKAAKLRYFNVAGAAWDDLADTAVMNLVPIVLDPLDRGEAPVIFGDDYNTPDGTGTRDYMHVADLAEAQIYALDYFAAADGSTAESVFNVGSGSGASVSEVIDTVARVLQRPIIPEVGPRRAEDPPQLIADVERIGREFVWKVQYDLTDIITSVVEAKYSRAEG